MEDFMGLVILIIVLIGICFGISQCMEKDYQKQCTFYNKPYPIIIKYNSGDVDTTMIVKIRESLFSDDITLWLKDGTEKIVTNYASYRELPHDN